MSNDPETDNYGRLLAKEGPGHNGAAPNDGAQSVSEVSAALKRHVEGAFDHVRIRGEISGFKRAASGHVYLSLKDENARIDGVMWKGNAARLAFRAEDGVEVIATGKLTTYPGRSTYQIVIDRMEIAGEGALLALLEKLKARLAGEGLFDPARKRPLPYLPKTIGVVTSPTGAVIRDILHRLADRMPSHVIVWPVLVQGDGAAAQVAAAVDGFNALPENGLIARPDLLIVARGGGSIEDLWSFNEEAVVRAIARSAIPVISAVGHETDTTLADFAADRRAPTPTAAAEMAVPVRGDLLRGLAEQGLRMERAVSRRVDQGTERLSLLSRLLPQPLALLDPQRQRFDEVSERLRRGLGDRAALAERNFVRVEGRFDRRLVDRSIMRAGERLAATSRLLDSLHPDKPLARGYARVEARDGATLDSAAKAQQAGDMSLVFADGRVDVTTGTAPAPSSAPTPAAPQRAKKPAPPPSGGQQSLF